MLLKMKTSMEGPTLSIGNGDEIPFDDHFPFSVNEVHRFCAAEMAELVGSADEIDAWLKANPFTDAVAIDGQPKAETQAAADAAQAAADAEKGAAAPSDTPPAAPNPKPAAAKAAAKKG